MASWLSLAVLVISLLLSVPPSYCSGEGEWDADELDIFDLVEEIGENFYDIMRVEQSARPSDIKRAYRKLSLQLHPDKSDDPNASEKFRKMAAVYEVLKDEGKRRIYDEVLEVGLPDWKQPVFYYRKVRKMGFMEVSIILLGISSIGHYLYGWANYAEKKLILQDLLERKKKKEQRKVRQIKALHAKQVLEAELEAKTAEALASKPKFKDLLPFLIVRHLFLLLLALLAYLRKKLGKKEDTPCQKEGTKKAKKYEHNGSSKASTATRRRNGIKRLDSGSSESEAEKKELDGTKAVQGNGVHRPNKKDGTEGMKMSSVEAKGDKEPPPVQKRDAGISCEDGAAEKKDAGSIGKGGRKISETENTKRDLGSAKLSSDTENRAKQKPGEDKKKDKPIEGKQNGGDVGRKEKKIEGHTQEKAKKVSEQETKEVTTINASRTTKKGKTGKADELAENNGTITGRLGKGIASKVDGKKKDKEVIVEGNRAGKDIEELHQANGTRASDDATAPIDDDEDSGWKVAGSGRTKVAKHKGEPAHEVKRAGKEASPPSDGRNESSTWTQAQQNMLEWGLSKYPKSCGDRWINIAKAVPEKSVEECKIRCVHLYEELKSKKS